MLRDLLSSSFFFLIFFLLSFVSLSFSVTFPPLSVSRYASMGAGTGPYVAFAGGLRCVIIRHRFYASHLFTPLQLPEQRQQRDRYL